MSIAIRTLVALGCLLGVIFIALAAPHEMHDLQRDMAVLRAEQHDAIEKAALQQKLVLNAALNDLDSKLDRLAVRLDENDKRIGDISLYISIFGSLLTLLVLTAGFVTYLHGGRQAKLTANEWMSTNGRSEIEKLVKPLLDEQKAMLEKRYDAELASISKRVEDMARSALDALRKQGQEPMATPPMAISAPAATPRPFPEPVTNYAAARSALESAFAAGRNDEGLAAAEQALQFAATHLQELQAQRSRGAMRYRVGRMAEALEDFEQTAIDFPPDAQDDLALEIAKAHYGKGMTLIALNRVGEATSSLRALTERFVTNNQGELGKVIADSLTAMAYAQYQSRQYLEAIDTVQKLLGRFGANTAIEFKRSCAKAELTRALALGAIEGPEREREAYETMRARYQSESDPEVRTVVASAIYNSGLEHEKLERRDAAREAYRAIDAAYAAETFPQLVQIVRDARTRLRTLEPPASPSRRNDPDSASGT